MWDIVGIREIEERVYETLARRGHCDISDLAEASGLPRARVTKAVTELVDQGMVTRLSGRPTRFAASPPDQVAGSLISAMEQRLLRLRGHARELAEVHRRATMSRDNPADLVEIVEGGANVTSTFLRLQQQAQRQVRGFDRPPYLSNPESGNQEETHQLESRRIVYRVVYDRSALAVPGRMADIWNGIHAGEQARVGDVPMKMVLCDDSAALIPAATSEYSAAAAYLIHPSSLLDAVSALFESAWDRGTPLNRLQHIEDDDKVAADDGDLLGLLAAGSTDETIARSLGWSLRTVRRHVRRLMVRAGVQTRFQLGLEAGRRRWL